MAARTDESAKSRPLAQTLLGCARALELLIQERCQEGLPEELARPAVMRLIPHLTPEGIRSVEIARRIDVSKQAVSQTLGFLQERGLVEFTPDPTDGRARLVRMTPAGEATFGAGSQLLDEIRREIQREVGKKALRRTLASLEEMHSAIEGLASRAPA
jgi:DNA-binding MarR family transcriptional regulator